MGVTIIIFAVLVMLFIFGPAWWQLHVGDGRRERRRSLFRFSLLLVGRLLSGVTLSALIAFGGRGGSRSQKKGVDGREAVLTECSR